MKFVDEAVIKVKAGHGGPGAKHFRREKYVPRGGPDGGNGGNGGSVVILATRNKQTLLDLKFKPQWEASDGNTGQGRLKDGQSGEDLEIQVPVGTEVINDKSGELVKDLCNDGERYILAKGGRGGKGNNFFKSATNQAPEHVQEGEEGEQGTYRLSLKLVADAGLVGFPNAGKSTLISVISRAKPEIADYPFTTITPNLGVVQAKGGFSFVVADIPGLIPGAHSGKGLGTRFLKHIERTRVIVHLIDPLQLNEEGEPVTIEESYQAIRNELETFSSVLASKPELILLTKADTQQESTEADKAISDFKKKGVCCLSISSVAGSGVEQAIDEMQRMLQNIADSED